MTIQHLYEADRGLAWRCRAALILLEGTSSTADQPSSLLLGKLQPFVANPTEMRRISSFQFLDTASEIFRSSPEWTESLSSS